MGDGEGQDVEKPSDESAGGTGSSPEGALYPLGFVACFFGFFAVFLGGLGFIFYRVATTEEPIPSEWYWAVAVGASALGAPLFLLDEKNPGPVRHLGRYLAEVMGVAVVLTALVAVGLILAGRLRMLNALEWAVILLVAVVVNVLERWLRTRKTNPTT